MAIANEAASRRFLTLRAAGRLYALPSEDVIEIVRVPAAARVPQSPAALIGIANLRGDVIPLVGLNALLNVATSALSEQARAVVLDVGAPVALVVDGVDALVSVPSESVETRQAELGALAGERLAGAFKTASGVAKVLDIQPLLEAAFAQRSRAAQNAARGASSSALERATAETFDGEMLVTFEVGGQEFALGLEAVQEIIPGVETSTAIPQTDDVVLGVTSFRNTLLPLLSMRRLLGFAAGAQDERQKIVVTHVAGTLVGLVADRARAILAADRKLVDPVPPVLAARVGGEAQVRAIYRGDGGGRLVSILSAERLFGENVMQRLTAHGSGDKGEAAKSGAAPRSELKFLVFRLGQDDFGLPIEAVDEVAQVPTEITRLPKTPKFLEGVINLRGEVLPVVDQRRRFDMPKFEDSEVRRLIVVRTDRHRAGLIVDGVSEVLRVPSDAVEPAPDLTEDTTRLVGRVINLKDRGRMVLLLDPAELLTRAEEGLLDAFQKKSARETV